MHKKRTERSIIIFLQISQIEGAKSQKNNFVGINKYFFHEYSDSVRSAALNKKTWHSVDNVAFCRRRLCTPEKKIKTFFLLPSFLFPCFYLKNSKKRGETGSCFKFVFFVFTERGGADVGCL